DVVPDARGCRRYADFVRSGRGTTPTNQPVDQGDKDEALASYIRACDLRDAIACWVLGDEYLLGFIVDISSDIAMEYYEKGCVLGRQEACTSSDDLIKQRALDEAAEKVARALAEKTEDTDEDGMPDTWEHKYFFNIYDENDAAEDANKNGVTNLDEFLRGTNPLEESALCFPVKSAKAISMICL
ncbi:MAG: hypothetical protein V3V09_07080, partial [Arenicellales bacterium]